MIGHTMAHKKGNRTVARFPSVLPLQGSNLDSPDPESDEPGDRRGQTRTLTGESSARPDANGTQKDRKARYVPRSATRRVYRACHVKTVERPVSGSPSSAGCAGSGCGTVAG